MGTFRIGLALALTALAADTAAQTASDLPKKMSGRWTAVIPGRQTFTDSISVVLDAPAGTGPVSGRLTMRGVTCGAIDEPLTGTWDGNELRFESLVRPNVNAQRPNGDCGNGKVVYVLTRKPGHTAFEGDAQRDGMQTTVQVTLSP